MATAAGPAGWAIETETEERTDTEQEAKLFCDQNADVIGALIERVRWYESLKDGNSLLLFASILQLQINHIMETPVVVELAKGNKTDG